MRSTALLRAELSLPSVQLRCLDAGRKPLRHASASGFIRIEDGVPFLYTCWHVVTGYDPNDLRVTNALPNRAYLEVFIQDRSHTVPLYEKGGAGRGKPLWYQDRAHLPHPDLNAIGLYVPSWHDAVKIPLAADVKVPETQLVSNTVVADNTRLSPGDRIYIVGFPYGAGTGELVPPAPVMLTRSVAAIAVSGRPVEFLLDAGGAPGMSGGPVFVERDDEISLLGVYTGVIYRDRVDARLERASSLGSCANLSSSWRGRLPLVREPTEAASV